VGVEDSVVDNDNDVLCRTLVYLGLVIVLCLIARDDQQGTHCALSKAHSGILVCDYVITHKAVAIQGFCKGDSEPQMFRGSESKCRRR
jgi:hypothetical protein